MNRLSLILRSLLDPPDTIAPPSPERAALEEIGAALKERTRRLHGRSLAIREVDAGSCNGCELEIHALNNAVYDCERFGLRFVASPRHADLLLVTGPVTLNMKAALLRTYEAVARPKWVMAGGDCALGCGLFSGNYGVVGRVSDVIPVDLHVAGCPPRPLELLAGLAGLLDLAASRR